MAKVGFAKSEGGATRRKAVQSQNIAIELKHHYG
jgi:hypothetical protein